jgi:hypothetical protein
LNIFTKLTHEDKKRLKAIAQNPEQIELAERMRMALENDNGFEVPSPKTVSTFQKETLEFLQ